MLQILKWSSFLRPTGVMASSLEISIGQYSDRGRKETNQDFHGALVPHKPDVAAKGIAIALADGISTSSVSRIADSCKAGRRPSRRKTRFCSGKCSLCCFSALFFFSSSSAHSRPSRNRTPESEEQAPCRTLRPT